MQVFSYKSNASDAKARGRLQQRILDAIFKNSEILPLLPSIGTCMTNFTFTGNQLCSLT